MTEEVNKELLKDADELINRPDREIMALSLSKNDRHADNYQMAMNIKLRKIMCLLDDSIKKFDKSSRKSSNIIIWLTVILVILTLLLSWQTFMTILK